MNNILVTGGAGYIGSHVCESLIKNKKKVFIVDNLSSGSKKLINKKAIFYKINILDTKKIKNLIIKKKIDSIIHLANIANDPGVELNPLLSWDVNVLGLKELLHKAIKKKVKQFRK